MEKHPTQVKHDEHVPELESTHKDYLIRRHGTTDLVPLPSADPEDPFNWPEWRKNVYLGLVSFHGFQAGFMAAGLVPAVGLLALAYDRSASDISYLVSSMIAMYGVAPFFWLPIMARIGRRPVLLISVLVSGACNVAGAYCTTYGTQMATRCITAFFIAPPVALGGVVVTDIFFQHQRGTKTGLWKLMFTLGAPGGPFIMGFVATHAGLKWTFLTFAIVNFAEFVAYLFFGPETMYVRQDQPSHQEYPASSLWQVHRFATEKFSVWELLKPFTLCTQPRIIIPICVYAIVFAYANIGIIIMYPVAYGEKFGEGPQGIGLQFIGMIVGLLIGEQIGGRGSDLWMQKRSLKLGTRVIADRLWLSYFAFVCVIIGLVVWGVSIQQARPLHWTVIPDVGAGIASCGNQIITTVLVTYAIDINPSRAAGTGLLLNFIRQTWGFIGPFYYPDMFGNLGFGGAAGLMAGIVALFGALPIIFIHRSGSRKAVHSTVA